MGICLFILFPKVMLLIKMARPTVSSQGSPGVLKDVKFSDEDQCLKPQKNKCPHGVTLSFCFSRGMEISQG